jgi:hypothetical protein
LIVLFMQLFTMAVNLAAVSAGARLYSRGRKLLLAAVLALAALVVWRVGGDPQRWDFGTLLRVEDTAEWRAVTLPLTWFFKTFTAEHLWPDLVLYAALGLLVNGALLGVVFALDANYTEASAAASARLYARIRRGPSAAGTGPPGKVRFTLPMPPALGGVGPMFWRQLITTVRTPGGLFVVALMFVVPVLVTLWVLNRSREVEAAAPVMAGMMLFVMATLFTPRVPFDFRGDVDRIALLKTLPIAPWRVALGQVLAPVVTVTAVQWLVLLTLYCWGVGGPPHPRLPRPATVFVACGLFAAPVNALLFALENLLFLLFPTRVLVNNPADFQATGRTVLFALAKFAVLGGVIVIAALMGGLVGIFFPVLGCVIAWLTIVLFTAPLLPLIGWAFTAFDVGRDTPA